MAVKICKRLLIMALVLGGGLLLFKQLLGMKAQYKDHFTDRALGVCVSYEMKQQQLAELSQLKKLSCQKDGIRSLDGLEQLTGLEQLYLQGNALQSLEGMGSMPALKVISVANNKQLKTLKGLEGATGLQEFQGNLNTELRDISAVSNLTKLRIFAAMQANISDISALTRLDQLEEVILNHNQIRDISALGHKPALQRVQLYSNPIESVAPLLSNMNMSLVGIGGKGNDKRHLCQDTVALQEQMVGGGVLYGPEACEL